MPSLGLIGLERFAQHAEGKICNQGPRREEQVRLSDCTSAEPLVGVEAELGPRGRTWAKCSWQCPCGDQLPRQDLPVVTGGTRRENLGSVTRG